MKWSTVALFLALQILQQSARAGGISGGYERVWIWYAYRIDLLNPPDQRTIAANCARGEPPRPCFFTELMEYMDGVAPGTYTNDPNAEYLPDDPENLFPDPDTTAWRIFNNGWTTDFVPANFMSIGGNDFTTMLRNVGIVIGRARNGLSASVITANQLLFENGYDSLRKALGYRTKEWGDFLRPVIKAGLPDIKIAQKQSEWGLMLDLVGAKYLEENEGIEDVEGKISRYVSEVYLEDPESTQSSHFHAIQTENAARDTSHRTCKAFPGTAPG